MSQDIEYTIPEQQKTLWRIELELVKVLIDFCEKNNLKIYACYGTLLGAARHKGFIPWDDDVDFVMFRDDYDRLLKLISKEPSLTDNIKFDISSIKVIKLRNTNTTMWLTNQKLNKKLNHGVWVDIFCMDTAPDDLMSVLDEYYSRNKKLRKLANATLYHYNFQKNIKYKIGHFYCRIAMLFHNQEKYRKLIEDDFRSDRNRYSGKYVWAFLISSTERNVKSIKRYERSCFDEIIMMPFEDIMLPCPKNYDKFLTTAYGDWRKPVRAASGHINTVIDVNKPCSEFVQETLQHMPWWKRYWYEN